MAEKKQRKKVSRTHDSIWEFLKKATAELIILFVLQKRPMYTYEIMQEIKDISEDAIVFNTLYQAVYRLQKLGYIAEKEKTLSEGNRIRIFFEITELGREHLGKLIEEYRRYTSVLDDLLQE